jgi:HK97 family phage major capsid protein
MKTTKTLIAEAKAALERGDLVAAKTLTDEAKATKAIEDVEASVAAQEAAAVKSQRLPFGNGDRDDAQLDAMTEVAVKTWYVNKIGTPEAELETVMADLYGRQFKAAMWAKAQDFTRFMRTGQADPRLAKQLMYTPDQIRQYLVDGIDVATLKNVQIESADVLGGYLVPEEFRDRVISRVQGMTPMRRLCDAMTTTRDRVTMPVLTGGDSRFIGSMRAQWVDESPTSTQAATISTFGQVVIPIHTLMSHVAVSKNALEDSSGMTSIAAQVERQFAIAFALTEDEAFLTGNGVAKPLGILNGASGLFNPISYGESATVNSGSNGKLTADAIKNTPYNIDQQYRMEGATWITNKAGVRVIKTFKSGSGDYLWSDRNTQLQNGQPAQLEGYGVVETEVLVSPTGDTWATGVIPVLFMCRNAYQIIDRVGMSVMRYDDSTTAKQNQIVLVARHRVGGQLVEPWKVAGIKTSA